MPALSPSGPVTLLDLASMVTAVERERDTWREIAHAALAAWNDLEQTVAQREEARSMVYVPLRPAVPK